MALVLGAREFCPHAQQWGGAGLLRAPACVLLEPCCGAAGQGQEEQEGQQEQQQVQGEVVSVAHGSLAPQTRARALTCACACANTGLQEPRPPSMAWRWRQQVHSMWPPVPPRCSPCLPPARAHVQTTGKRFARARASKRLVPVTSSS